MTIIHNKMPGKLYWVIRKFHRIPTKATNIHNSLASFPSVYPIPLPMRAWRARD